MAPFMWSFDGKYFAKLNEDAIQVRRSSWFSSFSITKLSRL